MWGTEICRFCIKFKIFIIVGAVMLTGNYISLHIYNIFRTCPFRIVGYKTIITHINLYNVSQTSLVRLLKFPILMEGNRMIV